MRARLWCFWAAAGVSLAATAPALPLRFEANQGQAPPGVKYLARGAGYLFSFDSAGATMALKGPAGLARIRYRFLHAAADARIEAAEPQSGASNYFIGRDSRNWRTGVPAYSRLVYRGLYPGLDLVYYGNGEALEYDLAVQPGADPSRFEFEVEGASGLRIAANGDLLISTPAGEVRQMKPVVRLANGATRARYELTAARRVRFAVEGWDRVSPLVVDPVLSYASFLGGTGLDTATSVGLDSAGNIYVTGQTLSANFPVTQGSGYASNELPGDIFVAKLNPAGTSLLWATFLGGSRNDIAHRIVVDGVGNSYLAGFTNSLDFPTTAGVVQPRPGNSTVDDIRGDAFLLKLNAAGNALSYATYLGGSAEDAATALAVDAVGNAYVAGHTTSGAFPVTNPAYRRTSCSGWGWDGFVSKLNSTATALVYSTYLCGAGHDQIWDMAVDSSGNAFLTGQTGSIDFPVTAGAFKVSGGGTFSDAFITRLNAAGTQVSLSTYFGGSNDDVARAITIDAAGNAYIAGWTYSPDFPTSGAAIKSADSDVAFNGDAFVVKLNAVGANFDYSTLLGGTGDDRAYGITLDRQNQAVVVGGTNSPDFTTPAVCQPGFGGAEDAFIVKLNNAGNALVYAQTLGGGGKDRAFAVAINPLGEAVFVGETSSPNMPTTENALRSVYNRGYRGGADALIARMGDGSGPAAPCISMGGIVNAASFLPLAVSPGELITIFGAGIGPPVLQMLQLDGNGRVATTLADTRVFFDGTPAPLFYVSATQVSAFVPYSVQSRTTTAVSVDYKGARTAAVTVPVTATQPGVLYNFSIGGGHALLWNEDGTLNSPTNPAARGSVVFIWGTGEGETSPAGIDGGVNSSVFPVPRLPVSVRVGGENAPILYAGAAPQVVAGVIQVNFRIPDSVRPGSLVPLTVKIGDNESQPGLVLAVK